MKKIFAGTLVIALVLAACVSTGETTKPDVATSGAKPGSTAPSAPGSPAVSSVNEMRDLMAKAVDALDNNHLAEAVKSYVAVIALGSKDSSADARKLMDDANAELTKIGASLSIEPGDAWIADGGKQRSGSTRSIGKSEALQPAIYVYVNFGSGKSPVPDIPIAFEFSKNSGVLINRVTSDSLGRANTTVSSLEKTNIETLIRAYPVFTVKGYTFAFKSVYRDFSYLPPSNIARIIVLERSELGVTENPQVLDAALLELKKTGLQLTAFNGKRNTEDVMAAFQGDTAGHKKLFAASEGASYLVFVIVEAGPAKQLEMRDPTTGLMKTYNIFTSIAKASARIVREDGTVVSSIIVDGIKGQGGDGRTAIDNAFKQIRNTVIEEIRKRQAEIIAALEKY
jgi:hypothetical protein